MAYCTPQDVSDLTGIGFNSEQERALAVWLDAIEIVIDDTIERYGKVPESVSDTRKKMVSQFMGEKAANAFQVDPTITQRSLASGDTSESETRLASTEIFTRITKMEDGYLALLGLRKLQMISADTRTEW